LHRSLAALAEHLRHQIRSDEMTSSPSATPSAQSESWGSLADRLDALVCGSEDLPAAEDAGFHDTMPAVCWAVPGAYAGSVVDR